MEEASRGAPFAIQERFLDRLALLTAFAGETLRAFVATSGKERYRRVRSTLPRPASEQEQRTLWRQRLIDEVLTLRLAGMREADIVTTLERRYSTRLAEAKARTQADVFELYMNAYARSFDPDARYFPAAGARATSTQQDGASIGVTLFASGAPVEVLALTPAVRPRARASSSPASASSA
ncbi:hypothetical protein G4G28_14190 [Massilia sp. Dwa41.01b]|uniref:hypothetical protein n=1 Tax=Massilia sp. Dwa41.01b TaxID=2709302 RepID=UPI0015FFBBE4|nr:hypothetical protein [Massilia sp. Dwa41.01b]QNA89335.1 hypothetical protein G4G28_14190 [Massilia sp. Dwa41.01b]